MTDLTQFRLLTCPKCRRRAYVVCGNRKCQCWRRVPKGKKPLKPTRDGNGEKCAYCGFKASMDWWFDRSTVLLPSSASGEPPR